LTYTYINCYFVNDKLGAVKSNHSFNIRIILPMLLGISEINKLIKEKNLLVNLCNRELYEPEGTVIDLRLDKLFTLKGNGFIGIDERKTPETLEVNPNKEKNKKIYNLNSKFYYMSKTIEEINLPDNISALFVPRTTLFRSGIIFISGFTNPGYHGPLYFGLFNSSIKKFKIEKGARFCSVYFLEVKGKIKNLYRGQWQGGRDDARNLEKQI